jgi:hypothetical protein
MFALKRSPSNVGDIDSLIAECNKIAKSSPGDVQEIASVLQKMIVSYYGDVRRQSVLAFTAALVLEIIAVFLFFYSAMKENTNGTGNLGVISGLLIQIMTGVVFYLYSQSARQFGGFHICLERTNRFLLANAMVEHLPEAERALKRAEVITAVLNAPMLTLEMIEKGASNASRSKAPTAAGR